ncbi:MAG: hypothetical protein K8T89_23920 [Planctomycetes bacterium]|nr:hypothetical protein [Planctomycetota bacterium]
MIRSLLSLLLVAILCTFAGAQGTKRELTAVQQQQLFQKNRPMIQTLVDSTLELSTFSGDHTERSRSYRKVIMEFQKALGTAADDSDSGRVAEIGKHLDTVIRQGLAPSLKAANRQIGGPNGTGYKDLVEIRDRSVELVQWLQDKARDKWADTPEVRDVIESLDRTKKDLNESIGP